MKFIKYSRSKESGLANFTGRLPWNNLERVKNISDNIFGFAMTLLIIGIHIPKIPKDETNWALLTRVASQWPEFISYITSFLNISSYWMLHNSLFNCLAAANRQLTYLNTLFLLTVTFLPYPTALQAHYGRHSAVALVYGSIIALNYALLFALARYAFSQPALVLPDIRLPIKKVLAIKLLLPLGLALLGTILSFLFVRLSFLFFLLIPLANAVPLHWIVQEQHQEPPSNIHD